jgi:hypothetical protein
MNNIEPRISKIEAVKRLHNLINQRNRLQGHISELRQQYFDEVRPHIRKSIESLHDLVQLALKSTNKRISLLDTAIERGDVV